MEVKLSVGRPKFAPKRRPLTGRLLQGIGVILLIAFVGNVSWLSLYVLGWNILALNLTLPFMMFIFSYVWWQLCCKPIYDWGLRFRSPTADEVMALDARPPVIYLRSFANEKIVRDEERALAQMLESIGPVIAIGRPGELSPRLGAHRFYVGDAEWQPLVSRLLSDASFVIILAGTTPGLGWEIKECKQRLREAQLLLLVPNDPNAFNSFTRLMSEQVGVDLSKEPIDFRQLYNFDIFAPLRRRRYPSNLLGFITFSEGWKPSFLPLDKDREDALYGDVWKVKMHRVLQLALMRNVKQASGFVAEEFVFEVNRIGNWVRFILIPLFAILAAMGSCHGPR